MRCVMEIVFFIAFVISLLNVVYALVTKNIFFSGGWINYYDNKLNFFASLVIVMSYSEWSREGYKVFIHSVIYKIKIWLSYVFGMILRNITRKQLDDTTSCISV